MKHFSVYYAPEAIMGNYLSFLELHYILIVKIYAGLPKVDYISVILQINTHSSGVNLQLTKKERYVMFYAIFFLKMRNIP